MRIIPYPVVPEMKKCTKCGECCGPVAATREEMEIIKDFMQERGIKYKDRGILVCGFLTEDNSCAIYDVRPWVCRIFGVVKELVCPYFPEEATGSFSAGRSVGEGLSDPRQPEFTMMRWE